MTNERPGELVGHHVAQVIQRLQHQYLPTANRAVPTAHAAASLAALRGAKVGDPAGDVRVWQVTMSGIPEKLLSDSSAGPTHAEYAVHAALVLWARHQQSRTKPMHVPGISLGGAVRELSQSLGKADEIDPAILRRFHSVATATSQEQRLYHLRSLCSLFRAHEVPLDYVRLATDLYLMSATQSDMVLMRWGRDLYRRPSAREGDPPGEGEGAEATQTASSHPTIDN